MIIDFLRWLLSKLESPGRRALTRDLGPDEFAWMIPPRDMHDAAAWDVYWHHQAEKGRMGMQMSDMLSNSDTVISAMHANGLRSVLFVGNGLAVEPRHYIDAGFDVTIMDLSPFAMDTVRTAIAKNDLRGECVTGDLLDPSACPGPFDVIVERRTLQLFDDTERPRALVALTNRLSPRGLFVTHAHLGGWRPGRPRAHPANAPGGRAAARRRLAELGARHRAARARGVDLCHDRVSRRRRAPAAYVLEG